MRWLCWLVLCMLGTALAAQTPAPDYAARGRAVVANIAAGNTGPVAADFDAALTKALPPERLTGIWQQITEHEGPYRGIAGIQVAQEAGRHVAVVECRFGEAVWETLVVFDHENKIGGLFFRPKDEAVATAAAWTAPNYTEAAKFHEVPITVSDGAWQLPGTLTLPNGAGPFPAVVLVQGSGPEDQDETIGPNKPFKDLAWGLASAGVAVLRYEKRTKKYGADSAPAGQPLTVNDETVDDARAAVALAARQKEIDPQRVYLLGHSLGGYLAPRIASGDTKTAGIILLAGSARGLADVIVDQLRYLATVAPEEGGVTAATVAAAEAAAKQVHSPALKPNDTITLLGSTIPGAYFLDLRPYDPAAMAARLTIPILVLQGGRDYQVTRTDYDLWQKALSGHRNARFEFFPALDHLFMTAPGDGMVTPHAYQLPGHVDATVVEAIVGFVKAKP